MESALNSITGNYVVVVWTHDQPQISPMHAGLLAAMLRHGASRGVFGSPQFQSRGAYILVGLAGCGEANGAEAYAGAYYDDPNAWCDLTFTLQGSALSVSGANTGVKTLADYGYIGALNATAGATWGVDLSGKPADSALLNTYVNLSSTGLLNGAGGGQIQTLPVLDRDRYADRPPNWYPTGHTYDFKVSASIGLNAAYGSYCTLETIKQFTEYGGGYPGYQYAYQQTKTWRRQSADDSGTSWTAWVQDLDRAAYTGDLNATVGATFGTNIWGQASTAYIEDHAVNTIQAYTDAAGVNVCPSC
jgi:hypothetical protein